MKKNSIRYFLLLIFATCVLMGVQACGGDEPDSPNPEPTPTPPPTSATMSTVMTQLLDQTSCLNPDQTRMNLINEVQKFSDACSKADYDKYYKLTSASEASKMESNTILEYYKKALQRIVREVQAEIVPQGKVAIWHLYNMGYVVKTPSHCFGIDLKHREAAQLVPYIEFLCITHEHVDHYSQEMNDAMKVVGKPVYSNFVDNEYKISGKKTIKPVDGIEMVVALGDHSASLKNFCVTYQIDCGADTGNKVIYHIGDTYNAAQLSKTKPVDIFIPHGGINMNFTQAMNKIEPKVTLVSHINELSHAIDNYRWPYGKAFERVEQFVPRMAYVPVWGEKMIF